MTTNSWIKVLLLLPLSALADVQAFTTTDQPFSNPIPNVTPCLVDQGGQGFQEINSPIGQNNLSTLSPADLKTLTDTMNCTFQAASLGITKVPAVVVDQKYVVYGNTDMTEAVTEIKSHA